MIDFLRRYVLRNFALKLISLALAIALWVVVARDSPAEVAVEVPIEFQNFPENLEISSEHIPQAQIRLHGPERLLRRLQAADVHPEIDLSGAKPGERTFVLTAEQVRKPYDLEVKQVVPGQIHLTFDTRLTRQVRVRPRVVGIFAEGYSIGRIEVAPPMITISGPRNRVEAVEGAITDPVDVSGTMERGSFVTHAYVTDPMVQVQDPTGIRVLVIMQKTAGAGGGR
jgi:YbbR domain-containing protein